MEVNNTQICSICKMIISSGYWYVDENRDIIYCCLHENGCKEKENESINGRTN